MKKLISKEDHIFVAGRSGMVGSSIHRNLIEKGYGVEKIGGKISIPSRSELDLLSYSQVYNWFKSNKPNVVIIAAAKVGGIRANSSYPADFILENLKIQTNLIEISWRFKVKRLLFLGSSCIYPKYAEQPLKEEYLLSNYLEATNEWYAIAKIAGIKLCQSLRIQYGFDAITLMPTNLYGKGDNYKEFDSHVLPSLIRKFDYAKRFGHESVICWGTGSPLREFLHVDDLGKACIFALENWDPSSKNAPLDDNDQPLYFLNVGTGKEISIYDLANLISSYTGFKGQIIWDNSKPDGTPRKILDIAKIKSIGWKPTIDLKKGIQDTILEYKKNLNNNTLRI
tara:strand:- start:591 stop:1607 length:1017 start_codon:yes stop_codon:yes gene_type:complete